jgi:D-alanyl-D-alanine carboxypeptidase
MPSSSRFDGLYSIRAIAGRRLQSLLWLFPALLPVFLAACGPQGGSGYSQYGALPYGTGESPSLAPQRYYPPPGPPEDPWGPYIREAAGRYAVPEQWVRAVMHQESDGEEQAVSPVGAMGLMQVMPETYEGLRERYGFGDDPYDPHNNILAGTAYIREMYDRFGAPGFLAAYNAGPDRVDSYLAGAASLPDETVNYLAAITPNLGNTVPLSGPLAVYASARYRAIGTPSVASLAAGCDLNAAYDPNHPCTSLVRAAAAPAPFQQAFVQQAFVQQTGTNGCDLNTAYDPGHPCTSVQQAAAASQAPQTAFVQQASAQQASVQQIGASSGCDLSVAYDPNHPCTSAGETAAAQPSQQASIQRGAADGCGSNAGYDPDHPCTPAQQAPPRIQLASADNCDPNAAFDPDRPCRSASAISRTSPSPVTAEPVSAVNSYQPAPPLRNRQIASAEPGGAGPHLLAIPNRDWAIQVGAFANPALARAVAEGARAEAPDQLRSAALALPPTPGGGSVLYRARLAHLSASAASDACWQLNQRQLPCVVVEPNRS